MADPDTVRMRFHRVDIGVALIYLVIGYVVTSQMWKSPTSLTPAANGTDQTFFEWMLQHAVRVFTHGENPLFSTQLNAPLGVNLMSNTNMLGLAIPFAPLTAWLGPAPVFVLMIMLGLAGTAFAWYYVLSRHIVHHRLGAFIGAAACGFGPGIITHANAHPDLTAQFLIPFILWRALALWKSKRPVADGLILGLLVSYQVFLDEELLFLAAFGGTLFVIAYVIFRPRVLRGAAEPVLIGLATAALLSAVLLAYPLWFQFKGPQHFSGLPDFLRTYPYELPLSSFKTLPTLSPWGKPDAYPTGTEQNSFLGWAMLILVAGIIILLWRRRPAVRALAVVGVFFAWASLGDQIHGNPSPSNPKPKVYPYSLWDHLSHLPLFDSVLAGRLALVVLPVVGVLLAFAVTDASRALLRMVDQLRLVPALGMGAALVAIAAACLTVVPIPVPTAARTPVPMFFASGDWRSYVPAGKSVLSATPYDWIPPMQWSLASGMDFPIAGGYFLGPATLTGSQKTPVGQFGPQWLTTMIVFGAVGNGSWALPPDASGYRPEAIADMKTWQTSIIVLTPNEPFYQQSKDAVTRVLGLSGQQVDDVWLWDVRSLTD